MDAIVYALCALTSGTCCVLLYRGYRDSRMRLLLWSALCFLFLAGSSVLVYVDMIIYPDGDLLTLRNLTTMVGLGVLIFGMIEETV